MQIQQAPDGGFPEVLVVDYSADRELIAFVVRLLMLICKDFVNVTLPPL